MFFSRKFTLGMFQRSVQTFVRNEGKSVRKLNVRKKTSEILNVSKFKDQEMSFNVSGKNTILTGDPITKMC